MNNLSQCIFDVSHVNKNLRDTLEFILPKEVATQAYESRKKIVSSVLDEKSFLGKFIADNAEKLQEFKTNYQNYFNEVYGDDSTILKVLPEGNVRVDHVQHIVIFRGVVYLGETIRDIMFTHVNKARQDHVNEQVMDKYVDADERFDRAIKTFLLLQEYQKSFAEFQKVMTETKGQPSPQSNYIVQNELTVLANMIRFTRAHIHFIDNASLDVYDRVIQLIEMCEGKRERRDNKSFPDLFKQCLDEVGAFANKYGPLYNDLYRVNLQDMLDTIKENEEKKKNSTEA